jgi:hypothetical protein
LSSLYERTYHSPLEIEKQHSASNSTLSLAAILSDPRVTRMADAAEKTVYRASTTAPVNIAVIK